MVMVWVSRHEINVSLCNKSDENTTVCVTLISSLLIKQVSDL